MCLRALLAAAVLQVCLAANQPSDPKSQAAALREFDKRIADYHKVTAAARAGLPRLKSTQSNQKIVDHQKELARRIRELRKEAPQGDIFTPAIAAEFKRLIAVAMRGSQGARIRQSLQSAEPVHLQLHVNDEYPKTVPVQSTPPSLLLSLPRLPADLEYRIVGSSLVLRDVKANLVVDIIPGAIP